MNNIENKALDILKTKHSIVPTIFKRYIDDIIMGPFPKNKDTMKIILDTFNSVNSDIQFTSETPNTDYLDFLDISISVKNKLSYKWYSKPCHSGISLRKDSWLPNYVKDNFVSNSFRYVEDRCSDTFDTFKAQQIMKNRLESNGFHVDNVDSYKNDKINASNNGRNNDVNLSLDYVGESFLRKINKVKNKYSIPVRITSKPGKKLATAFKRKSNNECTCNICLTIGPKFNCKHKYVVYEFSCNRCQKKYIGQTCRPFRTRFNEHQRSLKNRDTKSALTEHNLLDHCDEVMTIDDFSYKILDKQNSAITTRMAESRNIASKMPLLNRRHELT